MLTMSPTSQTIIIFIFLGNSLSSLSKQITNNLFPPSRAANVYLHEVPSLKERFKRSHEELHPIVDAEILVNDIGNIHEPKYFLSGVDNNFGFSSSIAKNDKEYIKKHMGPRLKSDEHEEEEYKEPLFLARNEPLKIERKESVASILGNIAKYKCSRLMYWTGLIFEGWPYKL